MLCLWFHLQNDFHPAVWLPSLSAAANIALLWVFCPNLQHVLHLFLDLCFCETLEIFTWTADKVRSWHYLRAEQMCSCSLPADREVCSVQQDALVFILMFCFCRSLKKSHVMLLFVKYQMLSHSTPFSTWIHHMCHHIFMINSRLGYTMGFL